MQSVGTLPRIVTVTDLILLDGAGNSTLYTADQLHAMGFATSFKVAGNAPGDFDGNGRTDLLWRNANGAVSVWSSDGNGSGEHITRDTYDSGVAASWHPVETFDWDGNGHSDILWRNTNGAVSVWNATTSVGFQEGSLLTAPVDRSWHIVGIGDFDGDGRDDILWRNDNGQITVWTGNGAASGFDTHRLEASAPTDWHVVAVGDYNGDHVSDILWRNDAGAISIWNATGTGWQQNTYFDASVGHDWSIVGHAFPL